MFLKYKIFIFISVAFLFLVMPLFLKLTSLKNELNEQIKINRDLAFKELIKQTELNECNKKLTAQNEQIRALKVDNSKITEQTRALKTELNNIKIPKKQDCKTKLIFYETIFKELGR